MSKSLQSKIDLAKVMREKIAFLFGITNPRPIVTRYYKNKEDRRHERQNRSKYPWTARQNAELHMQFNTYDANFVEVFDEETGEVHAQILRSVTGEITIIALRDPITGTILKDMVLMSKCRKFDEVDFENKKGE